MAGELAPGVWVEVLGPAGAVDGYSGVRAGGVYEIEDLVFGYNCSRDKSHDHPGVHLVGVRRYRQGFCGCQVRPIYRPSADLIESLKQPAPEAVRELVGL